MRKQDIAALVLGFTLVLGSSNAFASSAPKWKPRPRPRAVPELSLAAAGGAAVLAVGGLLLLAGRRRRRGAPTR